MYFWMFYCIEILNDSNYYHLRSNVFWLKVWIVYSCYRCFSLLYKLIWKCLLSKGTAVKDYHIVALAVVVYHPNFLMSLYMFDFEI